MTLGNIIGNQLSGKTQGYYNPWEKVWASPEQYNSSTWDISAAERSGYMPVGGDTTIMSLLNKYSGTPAPYGTWKPPVAGQPQPQFDANRAFQNTNLQRMGQGYVPPGMTGVTQPGVTTAPRTTPTGGRGLLGTATGGGRGILGLGAGGPAPQDPNMVSLNTAISGNAPERVYAGEPQQATTDHFNSLGQPYSGQGPSYWWNAPDNTWYEGQPGGQIRAIGANPPWQTGAIGGGRGGVGTSARTVGSGGSFSSNVGSGFTQGAGVPPVATTNLFKDFFGNRPEGAIGPLGGPDTWKYLPQYLSTLSAERLNDFFLSPVGQLVQQQIAGFLGGPGIQPFFGYQQGLADYLSGGLGKTAGLNQAQNSLMSMLLGQAGGGGTQNLPYQNYMNQVAGQMAGFLSNPQSPYLQQQQSLINQLLGGGGPVANQALGFANNLFDPQSLAKEVDPRFAILRNQLETPFQQAREQITADLSRRGILDSGIAVEPLARLEQQKLNAYENLANELGLGAFQTAQNALGQILPFQMGQTGQLGQFIQGARQEELQKVLGALGGLQDIFRLAQPLAVGQQQQAQSLLNSLIQGGQGNQLGLAQLLSQLSLGTGSQGIDIARLGQGGLLQAIGLGFDPLSAILGYDIQNRQLNRQRQQDIGSAFGGLSGLLGGTRWGGLGDIGGGGGMGGITQQFGGGYNPFFDWGGGWNPWNFWPGFGPGPYMSTGG